MWYRDEKDPYIELRLEPVPLRSPGRSEDGDAEGD